MNSFVIPLPLRASARNEPRTEFALTATIFSANYDSERARRNSEPTVILSIIYGYINCF